MPNTNKQISNLETVKKSVLSKVDAAIKSSGNHYKLLQSACIAAYLFAAEHGQTEPLITLYNGVSASDREGIRLFAVNTAREYAVMVDDRPINFLTFNKDKGFGLNRPDENTAPEKAEAVKTMKRAVIKAGEDGLSKIILGYSKQEADDRMQNVFDYISSAQRFIKTMAKNGQKTFALEVNRLLGVNGLPSVEIDDIAKSADPVAKLKKLNKERERLEKQIAARNDNAEPEGQKAVAAS